MRCSFQRPVRGGSTRRPVVKNQREPASGPADPQVETPAIGQLNMIRSGHPAILAWRADQVHPVVSPVKAPAHPLSGDQQPGKR